jgi:CBS domain containing-hemolysin-like protein
MTPRVEMVLIEKNQTLKSLKKLLKETPYSKIPVYFENRDNIVGIFNIRKALRYVGRKLDVKVSSLMDPPMFVPSSKKLRNLLNEFQLNKIHIAIVVGEYGGVMGVVTLEDILEELVGEITEDKDDEFELNLINEKTLIVEGGTELENVNKEFETNLVSKEYGTVAGFLLEKIDRFPKTGEKFSFNSLKFEIINASKNKIKKVRITK